MAAKLEWTGHNLYLGEFRVAEVRTLGPRRFRFRAPCDTMGKGRKEYESIADAFQDCESEVRRLLKKAGVDLS